MLIHKVTRVDHTPTTAFWQTANTTQSLIHQQHSVFATIIAYCCSQPLFSSTVAFNCSLQLQLVNNCTTVVGKAKSKHRRWVLLTRPTFNNDWCFFSKAMKILVHISYLGLMLINVYRYWYLFLRLQCNCHLDFFVYKLKVKA